MKGRWPGQSGAEATALSIRFAKDVGVWSTRQRLGLTRAYIEDENEDEDENEIFI